MGDEPQFEILRDRPVVTILHYRCVRNTVAVTQSVNEITEELNLSAILDSKIAAEQGGV